MSKDDMGMKCPRCLEAARRIKDTDIYMCDNVDCSINSFVITEGGKLLGDDD